MIKSLFLFHIVHFNGINDKNCVGEVLTLPDLIIKQNSRANQWRGLYVISYKKVTLLPSIH